MEVGRRTLMGLAATASCLAALSGPAAALPPAVGAPPRFAAPVELSPGGFASGVVAGDFNGDGRPDVAATNQADDTVTQWLRSDTGAFVRQTPNIAVGDSPVWIVTGDFNADGRDDAAVGNAGQFSAPADDSVSILLGSASGLVPSQTVTVRDQPEQLTPGDVDGDGDIDLVVANWGPGPQPMSLLRNDGAGRFAATDVSTGCPTGPASASIGEFTGDGRADIAVVCRNDAIVRILGADGSGGFVQPASGQTSCGSGGATDVAAADFDRDGALDLVVACGQARISLQTARGRIRRPARADGRLVVQPRRPVVRGVDRRRRPQRRWPVRRAGSHARDRAAAFQPRGRGRWRRDGRLRPRQQQPGRHRLPRRRLGQRRGLARHERGRQAGHRGRV